LKQQQNGREHYKKASGQSWGGEHELGLIRIALNSVNDE